MLNAYLEFGMCNCSENFMVMSRCYACTSVIFVDFSEQVGWYLVIMSFNGIKLINTLLLYVQWLTCDALVTLGYTYAYKPFGCTIYVLALSSNN